MQTHNTDNVIPHIHPSSAKRYCEQCGQSLLEKQFVRETVKGHISLPDIRSGSNFISDSVSDGNLASTIAVTTVGTTFGTPLARPTDFRIGQLPGGSVRAHLAIRDVFLVLSATGSVVTPANATGFLVYNDHTDDQHILAALSIVTFSTSMAINLHALNMIISTPITDQAPSNIGKFGILLTALALGTLTNISFDVRCNYSYQYEI